MEWVDRTPVCCLTTSVTVDQMRAVGSYWPEANTDPKEMAILANAANAVVGFESVRVPFCLTVEAEALGANVDMGRLDSTPMVKGHNLSLGEELVFPPSLSEAGRIPVILDSIPLLRKMTGGDVPVVPLVVGPFTLAGHLIGIESLLLGMIQDQEGLHSLLRSCSSFSRSYMELLDGEGVDIILISNPSSSAEMLSREMHSEFSAPYTAKALEGVKDAMTVIHICGASTCLLENMVSLGVDGLSVEEKVDPFEAKEIVAGRASLIGNVGVVNPLLQGTSEDVVRDTRRVMEAGFEIINPGCGLAPRIPMENLRSMVREVKGH
jgi:[methyl-Co(III) methanol-specific corrinoid protein]:coenzyme M methyltransferase